MGSPLQISMIVLYSFEILLNIVFLVFYIRRVNKLDKQASISSYFLPKSRTNTFRTVIIIFLILLSIIDILLAELDQFYWLNQFKYFALVNILGIINYTLQIYIICKQFKKKARNSRTLLVYWIMLAAIQSVMIVLVVVFTHNTGIILVIFNVLGLGGLIGLTISNDPLPPTSLQAFNDSLKESKLLPIIGDAERASFSQFHKIYIQFNKDFDVHMLDEQNFEYFFKIAVYIGGQSHIITKTEIQFIELSKKLQELFPNSETVKIKSSQRRVTTNIMKYVQEKQKIYETYLIDLTKNVQYYTEPLMNFLQINHVKRGFLFQNKFRVTKKDTINSDEEDKLQEPFFIVKSKDNSIYVVNYQILTLKVYKSDSQIKAFHQKLLAEKRLKVELLGENSQLPELMHFIDRVVNSKHLWRSFAEWMRLGMTIEDKIYNMFDLWNLGFKNIQANVIGHQIAFDKQGSVISLYFLSMVGKNSSKDAGTTLKKRFKDFVRLDIYIRKFIEQRKMKNVQIPSLPPKISPFGTKTSPTARQVYLDTYIKQLMKIQGINHCIKLLEFLEVDNDTVAQQLYTLNDGFQSILQIGISLQQESNKQKSNSNVKMVKESQSKNSSINCEDTFSKIKIEDLQLQRL